MITKLIFSNGSLTITFNTGEIYFRSCTTEEAKTIALHDEWGIEEVRKFLEPDYAQKAEQQRNVQQLKENLSIDDRFFYLEGSLYRVGIPLSIPRHLATDIAECLTEIKKANESLDDVNSGYWSDSLDTLDNFWKWTSLIRTAQSRESFYEFCQANNLIITKQGFVIGFRKVYSKGNSKLAEFVSEQYLRLRKNKKSTNVLVYKYDNSDYTLKEIVDGERCTCVGNLKDLFSNSEQSKFESKTTGKDGLPVTFELGKETRLSAEDVDWNPNNECSSGLHLHMGKYQDNYYGDTRILCAVNPMDVAACPLRDNSKFRVQALTPIVVLPNNLDYSKFELTSEIEEMVEEMFANHVSDLSYMLETKNFDEFKKHELIEKLDLPFIFTTIVNENKNLVKKRYVKL